MSLKESLYRKYVSTGQASDKSRSFESRAPYIRSLIRRHIPSNRDLRIVDLGCGSGEYIYFMKKKGYKNVYGVDKSKEQIDYAHEIGIEEAIYGDVFNFLEGKDSKTVDVIMAIDLVEHFTRDRAFQLIEEAQRVLVPSGKLILHMPNAAGLFGMQVRYGDLTHECAYTPQSARQILKACDFVEVRCFEDAPVVHSASSFIRRVVWEVGTMLPRMLMLAEQPGTSRILSRNLLATANAS